MSGYLDHFEHAAEIMGLAHVCEQEAAEAQVHATLALVEQTRRLADAQERTATAVEALALFRAGDELMTSQATEVQARDMYRAGVKLITGGAR